MGNKKLNFEDIKKSFGQRGYNLISIPEDYINNKSKLKYVCALHPEITQEIMWNNFQQGNGCKICGLNRRSAKRRTDFEDIKRVFEENGLELVSASYRNNKQKLECRCKKCGRTQWHRFNDFSVRSGCKFCNIQKAVDERKVSFGKVQKLFKEKKYILLSAKEDYKNCQSPLQYICPNHSNIVQTITYQSINKGSGCSLCANERNGEKQKKDFSEIKKLFEDKGYTLISKEEDYKNSQTKLEYTCPKHNNVVQAMTWVNLLHGSGCYFCGSQNSKGEIKISEYLDEKKIEYEQQVRFEDLINPKNNYHLSYDFYLPKYNLLIEYQGGYHDGMVHKQNPKRQTLEQFRNQQKRDKLKREYAKSHGYRLLEIWYWDFKNIEEILRKELI